MSVAESFDPNTIRIGSSALEKIKDNYPKYLLTTDSFTQSRSGIIHLNVFNWLLEKQNDE